MAFLMLVYACIPPHMVLVEWLGAPETFAPHWLLQPPAFSCLILLGYHDRLTSTKLSPSRPGHLWGYHSIKKPKTFSSLLHSKGCVCLVSGVEA